MRVSGSLASSDAKRGPLRIKRITGRNHDMLIICGVDVYPSQIEAALVGRPDVAPHYQLVVERKGTLDRVTVEIEAAHGLAPDADAYARIAADAPSDQGTDRNQHRGGGEEAR